MAWIIPWAVDPVLCNVKYYVLTLLRDVWLMQTDNCSKKNYAETMLAMPWILFMNIPSTCNMLCNSECVRV